MSAKKSQQKRNMAMEKASTSEDSLVISYLVLRKTVGVLGVALPFVVSLGGMIIFHDAIQSSISSYYHTGMRDVLVGALWTIGFFLYSYKGYERIDNIVGNLACVFAVGVSLFPTTADGVNSPTAEFIGGVHLLFAALFFLTLIYFSLVLFTKTNLNKQSTPEKMQRNVVYKVCGYIMLACVVLMGIYHFLPDSAVASLEAYKPVYWLETLAILTFGISWLTKGEAILGDK
jgi:uncharacterized membrane protein